MNAGDKCYIVTTEGKYCKLNERDDLVIARDYSEAILFPRQEAEARIGKGRKSRFYRIEVAPLPLVGAAELSTQNCDNRENADTMFEGHHYDWEGMLSDLCYMSQHMTEYQAKLHGMQSDVDQEISDIIEKAYREFQTDDAIAKKVSIREIEKNNFSLNITLYIQALTNAAEESGTPKSIQECYAEWREHSLTMNRNYDVLNELLKGGMENE